MHRLLVDCTIENEMFKVQVFGNISGVFLTGNELVAEGHIDRIIAVSFVRCHIRLITDFYAHLPVSSVRIFFNRHDTGH